MKRLLLFLVFVFLILTSASSQPCLPNGISFTTQTKIDSFQYDYPNCTEIQGDVYIGSIDITNLDGLNVLTYIAGDLFIGGYQKGTSLINLSGLNNVTSVGGSLEIRYNTLLTSLSGVDNLTTVGGDLMITDNTALTNLSGLDNLAFIGWTLWINYNNALTNITGLSNVNNFHTIHIHGNASLVSLTGLDQIDTIYGHLQISSNTSMSLSGLDNLKTITGSLWIGGNGFTSLIGLDNLTYVGSGVRIVNCGYLQCLSGLDKLASIGWHLTIWLNNSLESLSGLDNLVSIGGDLVIGDNHYYGNPILSSLSALGNLSTIEGELMIYKNDSLSSLSGLDNIDANSITNLIIENNQSLSVCEVMSVCNYLASPNGIVSIHSNATGCSSQEEVSDSCHIIGLSESALRQKVLIYPNPAKEKIFISSPNKIIFNEVAIYNQLGQKVLQELGSNYSIDVSSLMPGMYVVELVSDEWVVREKLIIR